MTPSQEAVEKQIQVKTIKHNFSFIISPEVAAILEDYGIADFEINGKTYKMFNEETLSQELQKAEEEKKEEIIKYLEKIESERWKDAEHCSCLRYAIYHLKHPEDDGMLYVSKSLKKGEPNERGV